MGVVRDIERRLEGLLEGFFGKVFRSGLQPVEVGRRIIREMDEGRTISVNRTYAPNDFRVLMGPDDYGRFSQMEAGLAREFSDLIIDNAKQNRWNLMGLPRIGFVESEGMGKGDFKVEASLAADPDVGAPRVSTQDPKGGDAASTRAISLESSERRSPGRSAELVMLDSSGNESERVAVTSPPVTIGRMSTNDVVLTDSNVSRRHAELRRDGDRWMIVDLGSTNGTLVNGKLAREHTLSDGDRISFGTSELIFKSAREG